MTIVDMSTTPGSRLRGNDEAEGIAIMSAIATSRFATVDRLSFPRMREFSGVRSAGVAR